MNRSANHNYRVKLILGIVISLAFPFICRYLLIPRHTDLQHQLLYSRFVFYAEVFTLFLFARYVERSPLLLWTEQRYRFFPYLLLIGIAFVLAFGAGMVANIVVAILHWHEDNRIMIRYMRLISHSWWMLIFCAATAGITEELIFRAYLLPRLQLLFNNPYAAIVFNSVLFSAMHYGYFNLREIIFTFLFSLAFGWHYQKYRNIKVLIIVHFLVDFISFLIAKYTFH